MPQLSVENAMPIGVAGMLADLTDHVTLTRGNVLAIPFGTLVVRDATAANRVKSPTLTTDISVEGVAEGIAVWDPSIEATEPGATNAGYPAAYNSIRVLRRGRILMIAEDTVVEGARPFFRFVAAGAEVLGSVRSDADTADAVQLPVHSARFETGGTVGQLVIVSINLT